MRSTFRSLSSIDSTSSGLIKLARLAPANSAMIARVPSEPDIAKGRGNEIAIETDFGF
jgi:hypothetical protein